MIEMCIVLMMISLFASVQFKLIFIQTDVKATLSDIIATQYKAIRTHEKQTLDVLSINRSISFNGKGNISHAMRIEFKEHNQELTLMLATGRIFKRRSEYDRSIDHVYDD